MLIYYSYRVMYIFDSRYISTSYINYIKPIVFDLILIQQNYCCQHNLRNNRMESVILSFLITIPNYCREIIGHWPIL